MFRAILIAAALISPLIAHGDDSPIVTGMGGKPPAHAVSGASPHERRAAVPKTLKSEAAPVPALAVSASSNGPATVANLGPASAPLPVVRILTAEDKEELRKERDAKERETNYTIASLVVTALFTAVLAVATIWLARETKRIREDTKISIASAAGSLKVSTDAYEAYANVERAWIAHSHVDFGTTKASLVRDGVQGGPGFIFFPRFQNAGRTPALDCDTFADIKTVEGLGNSEPPPVIEWAPPPKPLSASIGPGMVFSARTLFLSGDDVLAMSKGEKRAFIYARCDYQILFGREAPRTTEVFLEVHYAGEFANGNPAFNFSPVGPQNRVT